jgi:CRP-like cAMP-binding protein
LAAIQCELKVSAKDKVEDRSLNQLLGLFPQEYRSFLLSKLEPITLPTGTVLYEAETVPKYAHFMTSGIASVVANMADGSCAEVGIWGMEGLVESFHLLGSSKVPNRCFIQVPASALRMPFATLQKEFRESEEMHRRVLQCVQGQGLILSQHAACNRLHSAEERLARWLLMVADRVASDTYYLTQEFLADMLGARRATVTEAAGALQGRNLIEYRRGHIRILDRKKLEESACECYQIVRNLFLNMYKP